MPTQGTRVSIHWTWTTSSRGFNIFKFRSVLRMSLLDVIDSDISKDYYILLCCLISLLTGNENEKCLFCCWTPFNDSSRQLAKSSSGYRRENKVNSLDQTSRNTWPELFFSYSLKQNILWLKDIFSYTVTWYLIYRWNWQKFFILWSIAWKFLEIQTIAALVIQEDLVQYPICYVDLFTNQLVINMPLAFYFWEYKIVGF